MTATGLESEVESNTQPDLSHWCSILGDGVPWDKWTIFNNLPKHQQSKWVNFWAAVRLDASGTVSASSVRPRSGAVEVFFCHVVPSRRKGQNLGFGFDFCFTALQHIWGHFGRGQLPWPHSSWASLLGSLTVLSAHSSASKWQLLFWNQRKRENGRRNVFMTKSPRKNVPDVGIELGAACMPSGHASDRATAFGHKIWIKRQSLL